MNETKSPRRRTLPAALAAGFACAGSPAFAQDAASARSLAPDPNPYYIGVSQGLTHDSNVFKIPSGPSDNFSSTSLTGGFDQKLSRQQIFGRGTVSLNRYFDQSQLDNTSYSLATGVNWETIESLSGNLNLGANRSLSAPTVGPTAPGAVRNIAKTEDADARVRWGGASLLTLEGSVGYSRLDYSDPQSVAAQTKGRTGSLGLFYRPGALLRLGVAARVNRTDSPKAFLDPNTGTFQGNTIKGKNLDLLADYEVSGFVSANGRLSYTRQTNTGVSGANFSGITGGLGASYRPTARTSFRLDVARDAGFDASLFNTTSITTNSSGTLVLTPITGQYENNRVTDTIALGVTYELTAKINASAGASYSRAKLTTTLVGAGSQAGPESIDKQTSLYLGATYSITRNWGANCNLAYAHRDVTGPANYSYNDNTIGCTTQYTWR
jgi:hypothetical protein